MPPGSLPAITPDRVAQVLAQMRESKARGADGSSPTELRRLPRSWIDRLTGIPQPLGGRGPLAWAKRAIIALIPKAGADTEAKLRPIGLLPDIYKVWMSVRKQDLQQWSLALHRDAHEGAATIYVRNAAEIELTRALIWWHPSSKASVEIVG